MSIFGIDWNNDGKVDFHDTVMDCIILDQLEDDEKENADFDEESEDF